MKDICTYSFMGVTINPFTIESLMKLVHELIAVGGKKIIANHNLHSIALISQNKEMKFFYSNADYVHIDGMPLVLIGNMLGYPLKAHHRITYVDLTPHIMMAAAQNNWRICYIGSKPEVGEIAAEILKKKYAGLKLFTHHGYFDVNSKEKNTAVVDFVKHCRPDILMIGMGMPRQENWILSNFKNLPDAVILPCGAAFDYEAGIVPTPPRWTGRFGMEWLYRLLVEPQRLWRRYLVEPWQLAIPLVREFWKKRVTK